MNTFEKRTPNEPADVQRARKNRRNELVVTLICAVAVLGGIASFALVMLDVGGPLPASMVQEEQDTRISSAPDVRKPADRAK